MEEGRLVEGTRRLLAERVNERLEGEEPYEGKKHKLRTILASQARGAAGPDSDFDLLVVVADSAPPERKRSRLAYERLWGTGTATDVLVCTCERFDSRAHLRASLPGTILRAGKLLYVA